MISSSLSLVPIYARLRDSLSVCRQEILLHARLRPEVPGAAVYHVRRVVRTCARVIERNRALIFRVPSLFVPGVVLVVLQVLALGYLGEWEV